MADSCLSPPPSMDAMRLPWESCERCKGRGRWCLKCDDTMAANWEQQTHKLEECPPCSSSGRVLRWPAEVVQLAQACVAKPAKCASCYGLRTSHQPYCKVCKGVTVPAPPPYGPLADCLEEKGWPGLAEHFRAKCSQCGGKGELGESGGKLKKRSLGVWECGGCDGSGDLKHTRGCWALSLLLGKE